MKSSGPKKGRGTSKHDLMTAEAKRLIVMKLHREGYMGRSLAFVRRGRKTKKLCRDGRLWDFLDIELCGDGRLWDFLDIELCGDGRLWDFLDIELCGDGRL
jgi:hypothetical protein